MVSTEDQEIADIATKFGAKVPFMRSKENADDHATTADVILEVLDGYQQMGSTFKYVCCLYPTAPLISKERIIEGYQKLLEHSYTTLFPIAAFSYPIWRSLKVNSEQRLEMNWPEHLLTRSQDLPEAYHDCGQFYWLDVEEFEKEPKLIGSRTGFIELKSHEFQDIDNLEDWKMAEVKFEYLKRF
jgi:N-acylneuraminate cytidylyltransferase